MGWSAGVPMAYSLCKALCLTSSHVNQSLEPICTQKQTANSSKVPKNGVYKAHANSLLFACWQIPYSHLQPNPLSDLQTETSNGFWTSLPWTPTFVSSSTCQKQNLSSSLHNISLSTSAQNVASSMPDQWIHRFGTLETSWPPLFCSQSPFLAPFP